MPRGKIYYDLCTYEGPYQDAPKYGVICILQENQENSFHIVSGAPYYMYLDDEWTGVYQNDLIDFVIHNLGEIKKVIMGRIVTKKQFHKIFEQAKADRAKMDQL